MDHRAKMGPLVSLVCQVYQVLMVSQGLLVPEERRGIQVSWAFQEQLDQRELKETLVYQDPQESLDWLVCLDQWDQLDLLVLLVLLDQVIGLDLMTWRVLVERCIMDSLV